VAVDSEPSEAKRFGYSREGRRALLAWLRRGSEKVGAGRVIVGYETGSQGFVLCDEVWAAGFECYVLATTLMEKSPKDRRVKNDDRDAERILGVLRAHFLAGEGLPSVWVPDPETRLDREVVRSRIDLGATVTAVKEEIGSLLDRNALEKPAGLGANGSEKHRGWLKGLSEDERLDRRLRVALGSKLRRLASVEAEKAYLDEEVKAVASSERNAAAVKAMDETKGVGTLVAIGVLAELGDPDRFGNRRELGSYLGLSPSSHESGEKTDCKGHITHQGPPRLRRLLAQAVQAWVRWDPKASASYRGLVGKKAKDPKRKRIAKVAMMRRLGIRLWHVAQEARAPSRAEVAASAGSESS
jgi:transposase